MSPFFIADEVTLASFAQVLEYLADFWWSAVADAEDVMVTLTG